MGLCANLHFTLFGCGFQLQKNRCIIQVVDTLVHSLLGLLIAGCNSITLWVADSKSKYSEFSQCVYNWSVRSLLGCSITFMPSILSSSSFYKCLSFGPTRYSWIVNVQAFNEFSSIKCVRSRRSQIVRLSSIRILKAYRLVCTRAF